MHSTGALIFYMSAGVSLTCAPKLQHIQQMLMVWSDMLPAPCFLAAIYFGLQFPPHLLHFYSCPRVKS